jgi:hypothetical protein
MAPAAPPVAPSPDSTQLGVERLVDALDRRGLVGPASILLEAHRPILPLVSQGVIFLGPLLAPMIGLRRFAALRRAIDDPDALEQLASRLGRHRHPGTGGS